MGFGAKILAVDVSAFIQKNPGLNEFLIQFLIAFQREVEKMKMEEEVRKNKRG